MTLSLRSPALRGRLSLLAVLATIAAPASAQEPADAATRLSGVVVDAATGLPLESVRVWFRRLDRSAVTDPDGRFSLSGVPEGRWIATLARIGYATVQETWEVGEEERELRVALEPSPLLVERLRVNARQYDRRRRALGTAVRVIPHETLLASGAPSAYDLVVGRGLFPTPCPATAPRRLAILGTSPDGHPVRVPGGGACVRHRGRPAGVRLVVDGIPMTEGLHVLRMFRPAELYMVEIYSGGRAVRAYTTWFVEAEARRGRRPHPLLH